MRVIIGADHAAFYLKKELIAHLGRQGHEVEDVGCFDPHPVDFPDIVQILCAKVKEREATRGLMLCGTGIGVAIAANKIKGIRAAVCHDIYSAHQAIEHNNISVMCLGAQIVGPWLATDLVDAFLKARYVPEEDFVRRLGKVTKLEEAWGD